MTVDPAPSARSYRHELFTYGSDEELLGFAVPYLREAVAGGEPSFLELPDRESTLVRAALGDDGGGVTFRTPDRRATPAARIREMRALADDAGASGGANAEWVRVASVVPHPALGAPWHPWCRYEAAINDLLADLPIWGVCLYDRRVTSGDVLGDAERTHPYIRSGDGTQVPNDRYEDPHAFVRSMPAAPADPLETTPVAAELVDPSPADARRAVELAARQTSLARADVEDMKVAVSEAVTNAVMHGGPPVTARLWTAPNRLVATVTDRGDGPPHPYAGLTPPAVVDSDPGGYGLWITHQLTMAMHSRGDGWFTIRLIAGDPLPASDTE